MGLLSQQWCANENAWCSSWASLANGSWGSVWHLALLWFTGALMGWMLPRPKNTQASSNGGPWVTAWGALFSTSTWRRAALAWHGAIIMREVWYHFTCPGTFRRLFTAVLKLLAGKGWHFDFPTASLPGSVSGTPCDPVLAQQQHSSCEDSWYVTSKDLEFFKNCVNEGGKQGQAGRGARSTGAAGPWELLMDREITGMLKYTAWRRTLANGKTEYKSVTFSPNATGEEFMDMYLDDDNRPNWDTMIIQNEVLEHGQFAQRQQVVRWIRRFPFSFISDREYIIAKRCFREPHAIYGITKAVDHPRAPTNSDVVRVEVFYSMWRSRTVECPWGSGNPACETVLLHHEQMKIPENLARFAVKHGMWGFVRKLSSETPKFVESRRARCEPHLVDPQAYGAGNQPNPPGVTAPGSPNVKAGSWGMHRSETSTSGLSSLTTQSSLDGELEQGYRNSTGGGGALTRSKSGKLRGLAAFAVASGLAMLLRRSASSSKLPVSHVEASRAGLRRVRSSGGNVRASAGRLRRARTQVCFSDPTMALTEVDGL